MVFSRQPSFRGQDPSAARVSNAAAIPDDTPQNSEAATMARRRKMSNAASTSAEDTPTVRIAEATAPPASEVYNLVSNFQEEVREKLIQTDTGVERLSQQLGTILKTLTNSTKAIQRDLNSIRSSISIGQSVGANLTGTGKCNHHKKDECRFLSNHSKCSDQSECGLESIYTDMVPIAPSHLPPLQSATKLQLAFKGESEVESSKPETETDVNVPVWDAEGAEPVLRASRTGLTDVTIVSEKVAAIWQDLDFSSESPGRGKGSTRTSTSQGSDFLYKLNDILNRVRERSEFSKKIWLYLEEPDAVCGGRFFLQLESLWSVIASIVTVLQTVEPAPIPASTALFFEVSQDATSSLELLLRFFVSPNRLAFFFNKFNWVDLVAGPLPLIVRAFLSLSNLRDGPKENSNYYIFLVCFVPALRLFRGVRHFNTLHLLVQAFKQTCQVLPFLLFMLVSKVIIFSSILYMVEPRSNVSSLPSAMWLTVVTVGTVGYGDMVPQSLAGSLVVSVLIVMSALYMAVPIGLIGHEFGQVWANRDLILLTQGVRNKFQQYGFKASDVPSMFMAFDLDSDGTILLDEFCAMVGALQIDISGGRVVNLFHSIDRDGSGTIDDEEFIRALFPEEHAKIYGKRRHKDANGTNCIAAEI